ncbi:MAG TPA: hypothetical protein VM120_13115 [Bryobacteraceae bacterium]|nr:hypothetical protein [Bryobacteraceae bacterium]
MSALPYATYGIAKLYLFPAYQTREAFQQATGIEPPPFDSQKPVKSWFDPQALASPRRNVIYENAIAYADNGAPLADSNGKPVLESLLITRESAATVNIPPKGLDLPSIPTVGVEIAVPLRALEPNEELYFQWGGSVAVKNTELFNKAEGGFSAEDRLLLRAIAAKLAVS